MRTSWRNCWPASTKVEHAFVAGDLHPIEADEDVHTFLERVLTQRLGPIGGKLRAGRSRNDQAANDLKLYLRDKARTLATAIGDVQAALVAQAEQHIDTLSHRASPTCSRRSRSSWPIT